MGFVIFPVLEGRDLFQWLHHPVEWKWLRDCCHSGLVNAVCDEAGVMHLEDFFCYARQDAIENIGEAEVAEYEEDAVFEDGSYFLEGLLLWPLERQWFEPEDGLKTVHALLQILRSQPERFGDDADGFIYILEKLGAILVQASQEGRRFRLISDA